jgi:hypothetical protein
MSTVQPFAPSSAVYFDLIQQTLSLTDDELTLLSQNGFVVTDRVNFEHFAAVYAYLHQRDLPVLITTDSLLHATHQGFDAMLQLAEEHLLAESLRQVLQRCRETTIQMYAENDNLQLVSLLDDLLVYFSVPLVLLDDILDGWGAEMAASIRNNDQAARMRVDPMYFEAAEKEKELPPDVSQYFTAAREAAKTGMVSLFGADREIDFTLFTPRGHYTKSSGLRQYFRAQSWLQQIDFRLVTVDEQGKPVLQPTQLAAAMLLLQVLEQAGAQETLDHTEAFLTGVYGPSDNTTLQDFARFLSDAGLQDPQDALVPAERDRLLRLLLSGAYGRQRIAGQLEYEPMGLPSDQPAPRPVSLLLLGPRFVMDSLITSEVVFDRLIVSGQKMYRPLPHPLDVLCVLGNDRALVHLSEELAHYGYRDALDHLRQVVATEAEHRADTLYYSYLHAIRALNQSAVGEAVPGALRGEAWQDKMLQTQLAAWAELRHDSILYAKQSFTMRAACSYPAGYVEPYPDFYTALADYAVQGLAFLLPYSGTALTRRLQDLRLRLEDAGGNLKEETKLRRTLALLESLACADEPTTSPALEEPAPNRWNQAAVDILTHFEALREAALMLRDIAEKELSHESCSEEEIQFLKDTIFYRSEQIGSGGPTEVWSGWYANLFQHTRLTEPAACVADIHTKPSDGLDPTARVLHIATGRTAMAAVLVDGIDEPALYVGPTTSYYEFTTAGSEARRETDETWRATLDQGTDLPVPSWVQEFRSSPDPLPAPLQLR